MKGILNKLWPRQWVFFPIVLTACLPRPVNTPTAPLLAPTPSPVPISTTLQHLPTQTTWPTRDWPTPIPDDHFSATVTITATATEVQVGNIITFSLVATNTGKERYHHPFGWVEVFLDDGKTNQRSNPILEGITPKSVELAGDLYPNEIVTAVFAFRAVRPGTGIVKVGMGGIIYPIPITAGWTTRIERIRVYQG